MIQINTVTAEHTMIRTYADDEFTVIEIDIHEHDGSSLRFRILSTNAPVTRVGRWQEGEPEFPPALVEAKS